MLAPFQSRLPASVAERSKTGFGIPVHRWMADARANGSGRSAQGHGRGLRRGLRPWAMHVYEHFLQHV
jgi:hypothetical protein